MAQSAMETDVRHVNGKSLDVHDDVIDRLQEMGAEEITVYFTSLTATWEMSSDENISIKDDMFETHNLNRVYSYVISNGTPYLKIDLGIA